MLTLRGVCLLPAKSFLRHFAKKPKSKMANRNMVHEEMLRYVNPYARINIVSDLLVRVEPADVHKYTSGDVFIAQLWGFAAENCDASLEVEVCEDDQVVNVKVQKVNGQPSRSSCSLQVPIRSELHIKSNDSVRVEGIQGEALEVEAVTGIYTKNVRATNIILFSENGNIICDGTLLGKTTEIETHNGNISLDKLQGDSFSCSTQNGGINLNCCYVEKSTFQTDHGCMNLKNVHKSIEVQVNKAGELNMVGVHGNINIVAKGGSMNLQLSELMGKSQIEAHNLEKEAIINISETIEENTHIEAKACKVSLSEELEHMTHALSQDRCKFMLKKVKSEMKKDQHKLVIRSTGDKGIRLGKKTWIDMMRQTIDAK